MRAIRVGICALVTFAVLAHGAVEPWSEAVLEVGAAVLLLLWAWEVSVGGEFKVVWNPLLWPLLGLWGVSAQILAANITAIPIFTSIGMLPSIAPLALSFSSLTS